MTRTGRDVTIDPADIEEVFVRARGPGGQNVNKVSTAVQLRFDMRRSRALSEAEKTRLAALAGARLTRGGEIVITASRFRTQAANRRDAMARLGELLARAAAAPVRRVPTRPGRAVAVRRRAARERRSRIKRLRQETFGPEE